MLRIALIGLLLSLTGQSVNAECTGQNLLGAMTESEKTALRSAVDAQPYAKGNFWRASRGTAVIYIAGTYHLDDPRHDAAAEYLAPLIETSAIVLVEAGPNEEKQLQDEISKNPGLMFLTTGPTLPEMLPEPEWQALATAMKARDIPAFVAAKMRPWFITAMLAIPPCAKQMMKSGADGLDARVIALAKKSEIPIRALEPYDAVFAIFDALSLEQQLDMIRTTLSLDQSAEDQNATMADIYFDQDARAIWELGKLMSYDLPGKSREAIDADYAVIEEALMYRRNRAWIPVMTAALNEGPVFAAFGALHLSGDEGVLALLEREGFALERLHF
jgi:uncharacterized protein YbaP (TraB family)